MTNLVTTDPQGGFGGQGFSGQDFSGFGGGGFEEHLQFILWWLTSKRSQCTKKGDDLQYTMTLEFEEAVFGTKRIHAKM